MSRRAVVVGAGLAGVLAAAALSVHADEVIVLDRDELPDGPEHRKGLPQGRHAHLLMSGGLAAMEDLVPGESVRGRLLDAGAHEISLNSGMLALTPEGWLRRWRHPGPRMLTCSRALLDWVVREAVLAGTKTEIRRAQALELLGDARAVTGVRISTDAGETDLEADFVVDASGRGSRIVHWLETLGVTGIEERTVDSGLVNATRIYRRPEGAEHFPLTILQANPYESRPGRAGMVLPIEGDRWMVSLAGTRGAEPPADPDGFRQYMRDLPDPILARLISGAEPLTDVHTSHSTQNARRYLEKVRDWPEGLVVLGDALATFNPAYGQGMSVAALGAKILSRELDEEGFTAPALATKVQHGVAAPVEGAWAMAVGQDIWYPATKGPAPTTADRLITRYSRRLLKAATGSYPAAAALATVTSMEADASTLMHPGTLLAALNGPLLPPLSGPPLTPAERETLEALDSAGD
ncbi:FAD-dependent monooxygenase [Streptomyces sp. NBC_01478]|uniref:NAD(P)/FAD-dependent oxidoreductase n=1 Tax=Streptomyces sp. NBC_01478 TaxID=2903882 RepID=UPI002E3351C1|nr:FAD-dependent monooxygenase [Streptomyces sp. NBC_01478]